MNSFARILLILLSIGFLAAGSLWLFTPDTRISISGTDSGQVVEISGVLRPATIPAAVALDNGHLQVATPVELELPTHIIGSTEIEIIGGPGAPVTVAAMDKFGQTYRGRGERVVVWQGPLASGGVSSGPLRAAQVGTSR